MTIELTVEPKKVFSNTIANPGEGYLIAIKIALQAFFDRKLMLVFSPGVGENARYINYSSIVSENPLAVARGLARSKEHILVFADDTTTRKCMPSLTNVRENITYICCNRSDVQLSNSVPAKYSCSASVAFIEDYMKKLQKSKSIQGFSFLEIHCPSPKLWGYDPSNTIEVAMAAVTSGIWPLKEIVGKSANLTYKPELQEPVETYIKIQSRFTENDAEKLRKLAAKNLAE